MQREYFGDHCGEPMQPDEGKSENWMTRAARLAQECEGAASVMSRGLLRGYRVSWEDKGNTLAFKVATPAGVRHIEVSFQFWSFEVEDKTDARVKELIEMRFADATLALWEKAVGSAAAAATGG